MESEKKNLRLLFLYDIFNRQTDENHIYTAVELCELLAGYGISCERKALYRDIASLKEYGMDIVITGKPKRGYYLRNRRFDTSELRLLIDAVQAARFISVKKSKALIYKIGSLTSEYREEELREQVYVDSSYKTDNEDIFNTISVLDNAIKKGVKVNIVYAKRVIRNCRLTLGDSKRFIVNPYALIWSADHYYLICNNDKYDNLMHLRLDRIMEITELEEKARHFSEVSDYTDRFDTADYSNKVFNMFSGETTQIELRCSNKMIEDIVERFGENASMLSDGDGFILKSEVELSDGLVSWILQYGADIKVLSPMELKTAVKTKLSEILSLYE